VSFLGYLWTTLANGFHNLARLFAFFVKTATNYEIRWCFWNHVAIAVVRNYVHEHFGVTMDAISYTSARANLSSTMERVCNDHTPIIITRKSESPVVMMSLEDYQAMEETTYLLRSPANARQLLESIAELEAGNGTERELLE
jgi:antitoxin YefM